VTFKIPIITEIITNNYGPGRPKNFWTPTDSDPENWTEQCPGFISNPGPDPLVKKAGQSTKDDEMFAKALPADHSPSRLCCCSIDFPGPHPAL
jgi:hypothetical protein